RDRRVRRLRTRLSALPLERFQEARLLAADVRARAAVQDEGDAAEELRLARLVERGAQHLELGQVLASDVDEDVPRLDRMRGDERALDHPMRDPEHDLPILERARLGLVRVDGEVLRLRRVARDEAGLLAGGE